MKKKNGMPIFYKHKDDFENQFKGKSSVPKEFSRNKPLRFTDISEGEAVRHYTHLSTLNFGVDSGFYPLGSCTMKYNYKLLEKAASMEGFNQLHPLQDEADCQGMLQMFFEFEQLLCNVFGYERFTFQPAAGSHGEHTGLLIIRAYHAAKGQSDREVILVPDSAHGTNPASAAVAGFRVEKIATDEQGNIVLEELKSQVAKHKIAGLMLTNPSTLGLFETHIEQIATIIHEAGGLIYYDGANANALMGISRPGDMGFDVCHLNLHKTFGTPHGGGGPGSGPVGVKASLVPFLPRPLINEEKGVYRLDYSGQQSIGRVHGFYGNAMVVLRGFVYGLMHGTAGLKQVSERAILNANYLQAKLKPFLKLAIDRICMHECVFSASKLKKEKGVSALDIAKRLIDYGVHPPTIYFPLIVSESMMFEPTESETKQGLDDFVAIVEKISAEIHSNPELLKQAPRDAVIGRLDEARAVKQPILTAFDA